MRRARLKNLAALPKVVQGDVLPWLDRLPNDEQWRHIRSIRGPAYTMAHEAVSGEHVKGSRALKRTGGTYNAGRNAEKRMRRAAHRGQ